MRRERSRSGGEAAAILSAMRSRRLYVVAVFFSENQDLLGMTNNIQVSDDSGLIGSDELKIKVYINGSEEPVIFNHTEKKPTKFFCSYVPQPGDKIKLTADYPDAKSVSSEITVPEKTDYKLTEVIGQDDGTFSFKLKIKDNGDIQNYYKVRVDVIHDDGSVTPLSLSLDDQAFNYTNSSESPLSTGDTKFSVFTDILFDGQEYTLAFSTKFQLNPKTPNLRIDLESVTDRKSVV